MAQRPDAWEGFGLEVVSFEAEELVSLEEAKSHLRMGYTETDDDYIASLIDQATATVERDASLHFGKAEAWVYIAAPKFEDWITIPPQPITAIHEVEVLRDGNWDGLDQEDYEVSLTQQPTAIRVAPAWKRRSFRVRVELGTDGNAPPQLKRAALLLIGHWYEHRLAVSGEGNFVDVPQGYAALTQQVSGRLF